jgi:hypothetical protein
MTSSRSSVFIGRGFPGGVAGGAMPPGLTHCLGLDGMREPAGILATSDTDRALGGDGCRRAWTCLYAVIPLRFKLRIQTTTMTATDDACLQPQSGRREVSHRTNNFMV